MRSPLAGRPWGMATLAGLEANPGLGEPLGHPRAQSSSGDPLPLAGVGAGARGADLAVSATGREGPQKVTLMT